MYRWAPHTQTSMADSSDWEIVKKKAKLGVWDHFGLEKFKKYQTMLQFVKYALLQLSAPVEFFFLSCETSPGVKCKFKTESKHCQYQNCRA